MARKFRHGRLLSHKKGRRLSAGGKQSTWRSPFWETHCEIHGMKIGKDSHKSRRVSAPANKKERYGLGCPDCMREKKGK